MEKRGECIAFGQAIRRFRARSRLSQEELADLTGIHRTYIGGIERGERNPTLLMIHRLAKALGIKIAQLFDEPPDAQRIE